MNNFLTKPKCWKVFGNVLTAWVRAESDGVLSYPQISLMMVIRRVKTKLTPQAGGHCRLIFVAISASEKEICEPNPNVATRHLPWCCETWIQEGQCTTIVLAFLVNSNCSLDGSLLPPRSAVVCCLGAKGSWNTYLFALSTLFKSNSSYCWHKQMFSNEAIWVFWFGTF